MPLINGKAIAQELNSKLLEKIAKLDGRKPGLAFILVGENPASQSYVRGKRKACAYVGIESTVLELPSHTTEQELIQQIHQLNHNPSIDGILVQLPLPTHIHTESILSSIDPAKDVDGFHPINMGKTLLGLDDGFLPCTPRAVHKLLEPFSIEGKHVVIVGRSNIVGKPLAAMLMQKKAGCNATVTVVHSRSQNLQHIARSADILVAAIGQPFFIKKEMIKPQAIVIDIGINRLNNGKLVGDVDFDNIYTIAGHITPAPGGVGPMTIAMLLDNTFKSRTNHYKTKERLE